MHTVSFLLLPGFSLLEVSAAIAVFETANRLPELASPSRRYAVRLLAAGRRVVSSSGIPMPADALPARADRTGRMLIVAGGAKADLSRLGQAPARRAREWLARQQRHVDRGAALGPAALLLLEDAMAAARVRAPAAAQSPGGGAGTRGRWVATNSGWGMDVALSWIEQDHGRRCAETVAARLPGPRSPRYGPEGGRASPVEASPRDPRIAELHLWITQHLREELTVARLAQQMLMSTRSFARFHKRSTGRTPARAVERIRLEAACRLIETSVRPLKAVAAQCGYGSQEVMRRAFVRNLKMSPAEYRLRVAAARGDS